MKKKIEDYLHFYLWCSVQLNRSGASIIDKITPSTITMLSDTSVTIKPILRPLSDMTEEEYGIYNNIEDDKYTGGAFVTLNHHGRETLWLLKHGFDLFGLIEDGLAIDKTNISQSL